MPLTDYQGLYSQKGTVMDVNLETDGWLNIANSALAEISANLLQSINDGSLEASYVAQLLPSALDEVYAALPLDDISLYAELPKDGSYKSAATGGLYQYSFALPNKLAYVREVYTSPEDAEWKRVRGSILSSADSVYIRYVKKPTTPGDMPYYARSLLTILLASKLAGAISHDASLKTSLKTEYSNLLSQYLLFREAPGSQESYRDTEAWTQEI